MPAQEHLDLQEGEGKTKFQSAAKFYIGIFVKI